MLNAIMMRQLASAVKETELKAGMLGDLNLILKEIAEDACCAGTKYHKGHATIELQHSDEERLTFLVNELHKLYFTVVLSIDKEYNSSEIRVTY